MFVFPTLSEGFGIPVLEAFANNTPVITSNVTSIPEVAGDAAILIDPQNIGIITEAMLKIIKDDCLSEKMKKKGILQFSKFDWGKSSDDLYEIIKGMVEK